MTPEETYEQLDVLVAWLECGEEDKPPEVFGTRGPHEWLLRLSGIAFVILTAHHTSEQARNIQVNATAGILEPYMVNDTLITTDLRQTRADELIAALPARAVDERCRSRVLSGSMMCIVLENVGSVEDDGDAVGVGAMAEYR